MIKVKVNALNIAIWSTLLVLIKGEIYCDFDDSNMFQYCNATLDSDNILHRGLVSDKRKTFQINLNRCRILSIDLEAFYRLPALVILDLSENKLQGLELGVFDRVPLLSRLVLSHNLLTELPAGIFNHLKELTELDLKDNQLKVLDPGLFDNLPRLYRLDVSYNQFIGKNLGVDFLKRIRDLWILSLSGNDMIEADFLNKMNRLNYLYMDQCLLKGVPEFVTGRNMRELRHLSLSENEISDINNASIFNNLIDVNTLNLSRNSIEFIHENTFKPLVSLEEVDLSHNRLHAIPIGMFQNIRHLRVINLSFNLLTDISTTAFAETELKRLNLNNNRLTYLHEKFLVKLEDSGVMLGVLQFSGNPWQCACLRDLLREVKELEVSYEASTFDGQHFVCVTNDKFICKRDRKTSLKFINMFELQIKC